MNRTPNSVFLAGLLFLLFNAAVCNSSSSQELDSDVVLVRRPTSAGTMNRKGTIVQWLGNELTIDVSGREVKVENDSIIHFRTQWPTSYAEAKQLAASGQTRASVEKFQSAIEQEDRVWAQRIIRSQLIGQLMLLRDADAATKQFVEILKTDRNTRFMHLAPLSWTNTIDTFPAAKQWLESDEPIIQLVGASWSLNGPNRAMAIERLETLTTDIDPRISSPAIAQLWRVRTNVNPRQVVVWESIADKMPVSVRSGPSYVLGNLQGLAGQRDAALIHFMKVTSLSPDHPELVSASLFQSGKLLLDSDGGEGGSNPQSSRTSDTKDQARLILNELQTRFPESIWAQQAKEWK